MQCYYAQYEGVPKYIYIHQSALLIPYGIQHRLTHMVDLVPVALDERGRRLQGLVAHNVRELAAHRVCERLDEDLEFGLVDARYDRLDVLLELQGREVEEEVHVQLVLP